MLSQIREQFKQFSRRGSLGVIPFYTIGFPDIETTVELVTEAERLGVLAVELGVPFTDPIADGPIIQEASRIALQNGVNLTNSLELCAELRYKGIQTPLILMTYYNPIHVFGSGHFCEKASAAGVNGVIISDLPFEEAYSLRKSCIASGIEYISLIPPNCSKKRIALACSVTGGFVYCVSLTGVTGPKETLGDQLFNSLDKIRALSNIPIAVGFGISKPQHIQELKGRAEAVVVGSALARMLQSSNGQSKVKNTSLFLGELITEAEKLLP